MEAATQTVGVREAKNRFSELATQVNRTGTALTVLKNNRPWVVISPASPEAQARRQKLARFRALTASIEATDNEPVWDPNVSDRELLDDERVRRFG